MVDSNVLIYAYDNDEPVKQAAALALVAVLGARNELTLSVQVLNEFYRNVTNAKKRGAHVLDHATATAEVRRLMTAATQVWPVQPSATLAALDVMTHHSISFWDALLWATAKENGETIMYTEDKPGISGSLEGIQYVNPFGPAFVTP
jgi:predicted nucleic acid-binding protein